LIDVAAIVEYANQRSLISSATLTAVGISYSSKTALNILTKSLLVSFLLMNLNFSGKILLNITLQAVVFIGSHLYNKITLSFTRKSLFV